MLRQDKSKSKRQIALNIQTTGYEASKGDMITEIAAVEYIDGQKTGNEFSTLINNEGRKIDPGAVKCNKITNKMLEDAPTFGEIAQQFLDFIGNDEVIVHNAVYIATFIDTLMNSAIEKAKDHLVDLNAAKDKLAEKIEKLTDKYNALVDEYSSNEPSPDQVAALEKLDAKITAAESEMEECLVDLDRCDNLANTDWTTILADRDVVDVMEMHQLLYPRREGYSHKLNDICAQFDIDASIKHTAPNRAELAMQAYQTLNPDYVEKKKKLSAAQSNRFFGAKRTATVMNAEADLTSNKRVANR